LVDFHSLNTLKSYQLVISKKKEVYAVASTSIELNNNQVKQFSFDYSDKIIIYINGKVIFKGNNVCRSKAIQH
jgi:formylmethanofuran dehydrogenase subunit D